jgi:hypothetical protein
LDTPSTWSAAEAACVGIDNGNLVSIHDFEEQSIVMALKEAKTVQTFVWIGLKCPGTCSSYLDGFVWTDETPLNYNKFTSDDNGFNGMCITVTKSFYPYDDGDDQMRWLSDDCSNLYISICKVSIQ